MDSRTKLFHLSPVSRRVATVLSLGLAFVKSLPGYVRAVRGGAPSSQ